MGATPRGDLPRNEGRRNYIYGPVGGYGNHTGFHARTNLLRIHFAAIKTPEDLEARAPLFEAIEAGAQATLAAQYGEPVAGSRDRSLRGKARIRARRAAR